VDMRRIEAGCEQNSVVQTLCALMQ
jgi:hypothetical protein